jgi:hypothetical protein
MLHESGKRIRWRPEIGHGGNKRLRTALYLATLNVVRFNPVIWEFYERLITAEKTKKWHAARRHGSCCRPRGRLCIPGNGLTRTTGNE